MERLANALDCCMECVVLKELVSVLVEVLVFGLKKEKSQLSKWSFLIYTKGDSAERPRIMNQADKHPFRNDYLFRTLWLLFQ